MRHEWFECWIRDLGSRENIAILTLWVDGQLMAVAPMQVARQKIKGLPLKAFTFLSSTISPRCNFIVHESVDKRRFFEELFRQKGWNLIITSNMEAAQQITKDYIDYLHSCRGGRFQIEPGRQSPYQIISENWDSYFNGLSKNHRKNLRKALKGLDEAASHSFEQYDEFEKLDGIFDEIVAVSGSSWKAELGSDMSSNSRISSFYKNFSRAGSKDGLWQLYTLKIDGKYVAFDYLLKHGKRLTGIRSDYHKDYRDYMPGHLMKIATIKDLCGRNEGWEYDMGGMAVEYKMRYADQMREHVNITAAGPGLYGSLLMFGKSRVLPFLKNIRKEKQPQPESAEAAS